MSSKGLWNLPRPLVFLFLSSCLSDILVLCYDTDPGTLRGHTSIVCLDLINLSHTVPLRPYASLSTRLYHIQVHTVQKQWAWGAHFILISLWQRNSDDPDPIEDNTWKMTVEYDSLRRPPPYWFRSLLFGDLNRTVLLFSPTFFQIQHLFFRSYWFLWELGKLTHGRLSLRVSADFSFHLWSLYCSKKLAIL